jgi:hypothetical protein
LNIIMSITLTSSVLNENLKCLVLHRSLQNWIRPHTRYHGVFTTRKLVEKIFGTSSAFGADV